MMSLEAGEYMLCLDVRDTETESLQFSTDFMMSATLQSLQIRRQSAILICFLKLR